MLEKYGCIVRAKGLDVSRISFELGEWRLPNDYLRILVESNGFVAHHGAFRLFSYGKSEPLTDALIWNRSPWRLEYGDMLPREMFIWAEDAFGDQYGYMFGSGGAYRLVKLWCEGGTIQNIVWRDVTAFLQNEIFTPRGDMMIDLSLFEEARAIGLRPSLSQHLAFRTPLVYGGQSERANLEVANASVHLSLLGKISKESACPPSGVPSKNFSSHGPWGNRGGSVMSNGRLPEET